MAIQARGAFRTLKASTESTYGTKKTSGYIQLPFNENSVNSTEDEIDPATITGDRYDVEPAYGNISVSGTTTIPLDWRNLGFWCYWLMGGYAKTGTGPYTHTFTPANTLPSFSLEEGCPDITHFRQFMGCKVNSMNFRFSQNEELVSDVEIVGKEEDTPAASTIDATPKTYTFNRFNAKDATLKLGTSPASSILTITELDLTISNNIFADNYTIGENGFIHSAIATGFTVEGSYTVLFDSTDGVAFYLAAINGTERELEITLTSGTNTLVMSVYEFKVGRTPPTTSGKGPIVLTHSFRGYYQDNANARPFDIVLTNDVADDYDDTALEP